MPVAYSQSVPGSNNNGVKLRSTNGRPVNATGSFRYCRQRTSRGWYISYPNPEEWESKCLQFCQHDCSGSHGRVNQSYRRVIFRSAGFKIGFPVSLSKPVKISAALSSGRMVVTSLSRLSKPRSTHCIAATEVISFDDEAIQKTVSSEYGFLVPFSSQAPPKAF